LPKVKRKDGNSCFSILLIFKRKKQNSFDRKMKARRPPETAFWETASTARKSSVNKFF